MGFVPPGVAATRPRTVRSLLRSTVAAGLSAAGLVAAVLVAAAPAQAQPPATDLTISVTNKADAHPGQPITYEVVVRNNGPVAASRVQFDFTTTTPLTSVRYTIGNGL